MKSTVRLLLLAAVSCFSFSGYAQTAHFSGTQLTLASSGLSSPLGLAIDTSGSLYIADSANNRVLKETLSGGTYTQTVLGSGMLAPTGVAVDSTGNVYIADTQNNRVLKETLASGSYTQSTVGTGLSGPNGLAVDTTGDVFISDTLNGRVLKEVPASGTYSPVTVASSLSQATGLAIDGSGNVYISDDKNNRVLKETLTSGYYTQSVAGTAGLGAPWGVATDATGNVYLADTTHNRVIEELVSTPSVGTVNLGSTSLISSLIFNFDTAGTIAAPAVLTQGISGQDFLDAGTGTCTTNGTTYTYSAGATCSVDVVLTPKAVGVRYGATVLLNASGSRIATGYIQGSGSGPQVSFLPGTITTLPFTLISNPYVFAIAIDAANNMYLSESSYADNPINTLVKETWTGNGYAQSTIATGFDFVTQIAVDGAGDIYLADQDAAEIFEEIPTASGGYRQVSLFGGLGNVEGVAVDGSGNVYIASVAYGLVKETLSGGVYTKSIIQGQGLDSQVTVDGNGVIYVAGGALYKPQPNGTYTSGTFPGGGSVAVDPNGNLFVSQQFGNALYKDALSGGAYSQSTFATFANPVGSLTFDASGNLFFVGSGVISKYDFSDPPSLIFDTTAVGHTSADSPQTVTLENTGNASLIFPVPASGSNPSITTNFSLNSGSGSACPLLNTSSFTSATLAAGASCLLPVSYTPTAATPASGFLTLTDNAAITTQQISLGVSGIQATPAIDWATPSTVVYGTALGAPQLNASSSVAGTFTYTPAAGTVLGVGANTLSVTFSPTNTAQYATSSATTTLTVTQATPSISWTAPVAITYGTALSTTQLNASSAVAGVFSYTPATGTLLTPGTHVLSVTFTPTDTTDYTTSAATVSITVNQATPTVSWTTPTAITYGTQLSATQLNATASFGGNSLPGSFTYTPAAGTTPTAGTRTLSVTFTPTDSADYTSATQTVQLIVSRATPTVSWTAPTAITYGTPLSATQLNATASFDSNRVSGYFAYSPAAGTVPAAGTPTLSVTFTPTDTTDYTSVTQTVQLTVSQATPTVIWSTPTAITYGTPLSTTQLNATASFGGNGIPGSFAYAPAAGTVPTVGVHTLSVTFTPTDATDYTTTTATVQLTVSQATPTLTWAAPAAITYGTALSNTQLNASTPTPGTFSYTPGAGTTLAAGPQTLSVTFTPTDTTDYHTATSTVPLTVNKAALVIGANNTARVFGAANPTFTGTVSGATNGDNFTETFATVAVPSSIVGGYAIVPSVTGTDLADYNVTANNGVLTVSQAGTTTTFALSNQNLTLTATVASLTSGTPTGTVGFYEGQTLVGTGTLTNGVATYTASTFPSGDVVVSAQYSGDVDFTQSAAPPILSLSVSPAATSLTVARSGSTTDALNLAVAPGYSGTVQFACSGLPAGSICTFSPASVAFTGNSSTATTTLTIQTSAIAGLSLPALSNRDRRMTALAALLWLPALGTALFAGRRRKLSPRLRMLIVLLLLSGLSAGLTACGSSPSSGTGSGSGTQTPVGSSTVQVVASGPAGLAQTTSLTLIVQ